MLTDTMSWPELVLLLVCIPAVWYKLIFLRQLRVDYEDASQDRREDARDLAFAHMRTAYVRLGIKTTILILAFYAAYTPPSNPARPITPLAIVLYLLFAAIVGALFLDSYLARRTQVRIIARGKIAGATIRTWDLVNDKFEEVDDRLSRIELLIEQLIERTTRRDAPLRGDDAI